MILGYSRVSKGEEQNSNLQIKALKEANVQKLYDEIGSGGRWNRLILHKMIEQLRDGDVVVVWKLDRLSRSLKDLLVIMEQIDKAGAGFRSLTESIDTTTPAGRMMMQMVGSFAEFERMYKDELLNALNNLKFQTLTIARDFLLHYTTFWTS